MEQDNINEQFSQAVNTGDEPETLASQVRRLENQAKYLSEVIGTISATMLVNYGKNGKSIPGLIREENTLQQMVIIPLQYLADKNNELEAKNKYLNELLITHKQGRN